MRWSLVNPTTIDKEGRIATWFSLNQTRPNQTQQTKTNQNHTQPVKSKPFAAVTLFTEDAVRSHAAPYSYQFVTFL